MVLLEHGKPWFMFPAVLSAYLPPLHSKIVHGLAAWAYAACASYKLMKPLMSILRAASICWGLASSCLGAKMQTQDRL